MKVSTSLVRTIIFALSHEVTQEIKGIECAEHSASLTRGRRVEEVPELEITNEKRFLLY